MGMYDTINGVIVKCPRCGDYGPKSVQIKSGPQILGIYQFRKDKIDINWDYEYYGSVIDREKRIIRGIADCDTCRKDINKKIDDIKREARHLFGCGTDRKDMKNEKNGKDEKDEKDEKDSLAIALDRLRNVYETDGDVSLFEVAIWLDKDNIPIYVDVIFDVNRT